MTYSTPKYELHDVRRIVIAGERWRIATYRDYCTECLVIWRGNHRNSSAAFFQDEGEHRVAFIKRVRKAAFLPVPNTKRKYHDNTNRQ